ncbi:MAG: BatD family protein [Hydrogenophilales bacterium]|nr:BatD family protein [Hydrogenophilales bacterium]
MVRALILLLAASAAHAASLTARLDRTAVALGEPVSLTVQARGLNLDALDLAPLGAAFDVFARTLSGEADSEALVLTLYPRAAGTLQIPALHLETQRTPALSLSVSDGSATVPRVTVDWTLDPAMPRVNQPTRLSLAICDDGSLQWQRPELPTRAGRVVRVLGEDEGTRVRGGGETCTMHRYYWALLATQGGAATLAVPMLDASRFGQRLRFPGPSLAFQATALPAWLPEHVPPVAPVIRADPLPARWPVQRPLSWRFEVVGGYSAEGLKALLDLQLRETPALGIYPPLIEAVAPDDPASPLSRYVVTLFLEPRARGQLSLPALRLPWYDAAHGRLASMPVAGKTLTVFDPRWQRVKQGMGGLAGALLLAGLIGQVRRMVRWRRARRRGLRAIREARDVAGLDRAVRQFSLTDQPAASSLGEWQRRLVQETEAGDVAEAVRQLEHQRFGRASPTLATLQQAFVQALAQTRPKRLPRLRASLTMRKHLPQA